MEKEYACDAWGLGDRWTPRHDPRYQAIVHHYTAESVSFLSKPKRIQHIRFSAPLEKNIWSVLEGDENRGLYLLTHSLARPFIYSFNHLFHLSQISLVKVSEIIFVYPCSKRISGHK